jgi:hypothetical protein
MAGLSLPSSFFRGEDGTMIVIIRVYTTKLPPVVDLPSGIYRWTEDTMPTKPNEYAYIRAWGRMMHSNRHYIDAQVQQARTDKAPDTAIYKDSISGEWHTYEGIMAADTKLLIDQIMGKK